MKERNIAIISAVVGIVVIATVVIFVVPLPAGIYGIISVLIAAVLTAWLGPWLREKFELRRIYLAPFRKWCRYLRIRPYPHPNSSMLDMHGGNSICGK